MKIQQILQMSTNLQHFAKFQKLQLDNLVDFEKCCKTRIFLQKSVPIQPKKSVASFALSATHTVASSNALASSAAPPSAKSCPLANTCKYNLFTNIETVNLQTFGRLVLGCKPIFAYSVYKICARLHRSNLNNFRRSLIRNSYIGH